MTNEIKDALLDAFSVYIPSDPTTFNTALANVKKLEAHITQRDIFVMIQAINGLYGAKYTKETHDKVLKEYITACDRYLPKDLPSAINEFFNTAALENSKDNTIPNFVTNSMAFMYFMLWACMNMRVDTLKSIYTFPAEDATS